MKIASIIPKISGGGAERIAANITKFFRPNFSHDLIIFQKSNKEYDYQGGLVNLNAPSAPGAINKVLITIKRYIGIASIKKERGYKVVMSHLYIPNILNAFSAKKDKTILIIHGPASLYQNKFEKWLAGKAYNKANFVVGTSKFFSHQVEKKLNVPIANIKTIYNPIDIALINQLKTDPLSPEEEAIFKHPTFINAGRFSLQKAPWHTIKAFREVAKVYPEAQLVFLGEGTEEITTQLKILSEKCGLSDRIHFFGNVVNPFKFFYRSFAFLYSSMWDALPMVLLESLACGLPIISTDCDSGPREILAPQSDFLKRTTHLELGEYGFLCPKCDGQFSLDEATTKEEQILAEACLQLLKNEEMHDSLRSKAVAYAQEFEGKKIVAQYEQLIDELIRNEN